MKTQVSYLPPNERVAKAIRPREKQCVNIPILGHRDPRGADNNVRVWVDEHDALHIRVEKNNRCYQFKKMINTSAYVEIIAD